jgi:hypothetical protein
MVFGRLWYLTLGVETPLMLSLAADLSSGSKVE